MEFEFPKTREEYEAIARAMGVEPIYRHGRPVITLKMANLIKPPFPPEYCVCGGQTSTNGARLDIICPVCDANKV